MNAALAAWNQADAQDALETMLACCGAQQWAEAMVARRPMRDVVELSTEADSAWAAMEEADWMEAFACHPRIGERKAAHASAQSVAWSRQEQAGAAGAAALVLEELAEGNVEYEEKFGFTYIVCATGKSAEEMLAMLKNRLGRTRVMELREAAEQQRQIMQIRLGKWLSQ
ncbi:MAG TPA: 2-oxo-4-hydroxy-4-carboxy-5-ureidoimidazoline decarboxylase [Terracidiphilus sp.]|nr:2-oxo-4-hydroxy-4-carboxy-5-ureidoimidazoline decarboxylase [Terracidiphilus sp.]